MSDFEGFDLVVEFKLRCLQSLQGFAACAFGPQRLACQASRLSPQLFDLAWGVLKLRVPLRVPQAF